MKSKRRTFYPWNSHGKEIWLDRNKNKVTIIGEKTETYFSIKNGKPLGIQTTLIYKDKRN